MRQKLKKSAKIQGGGNFLGYPLCSVRRDDFGLRGKAG